MAEFWLFKGDCRSPYFLLELLHLELSRACLVSLSCLSLLTKQPSVCQITVRMCLFVTSTVATQFTALPTVQVTFLQTNCTTAVTVDSSPHSCNVCFSVTSLNVIWSFFWHLYRPQTNIIWNIKCFVVGEIQNIFQSTSGLTRGRNFLSGTSEDLLKFLYVCPVFRSNLVLFLFHSN